MLSKIRITHVLLLAFVLRFLFFLVHQPWDAEVERTQVVTGDAVQYHYLANCIVQHFSFCDNTFRTPGYPAFLAVFYFIFGAKTWIPLFVQVCLSVFSVFLLYKLSLRLFNKKVALLAAFLLAIDPHQILFANFLFTDTLFALLFLLTFYFYVKGLQDGETKWFVISAIFLGLNLLTKPVIQFYPLALVLFLLVWTKFTIAMRLKNAFIVLVLSYLFVLPWMYRNYVQFEHFSVCSISGFNLFYYNVPLTETKLTKVPFDTIINRNLRILKAEHPEATGLPNSTNEMWRNISFENNDLYDAFAKDYLKQHKVAYAKAHVNGMVKLMLNLGTQNFLERLHVQTANKWNYEQRYTLGFLQQLVLFVKTKGWQELLLGLAIVLLMIVTYFGFFVGTLDMIFLQRNFVLWLLFAGSIFYFLMIYGVLPIVRFKLPISMLYLPISALGILKFRAYLSSRRLKM